MLMVHPPLPGRAPPPVAPRTSPRRQYCARRLRSLYKATKFLHGKGRYTKRKLDVPHVTDAK